MIKLSVKTVLVAVALTGASAVSAEELLLTGLVLITVLMATVRFVLERSAEGI